MKKLLIALCALATTAVHAQSHEGGTILVQLGYEFGISTSFGGERGETDLDKGDFDTSIGGIRGDVQFGLGDNFGLGLLIRSATSKVTYNVVDDATEVETGHLDIGLEPRFYFVNQDAINVFASVMTGASFHNPKEIEGPTQFGNISGLFFGFGAGMNYFFTENIGANARLGFSSRAYAGDEDIEVNGTVEGSNDTQLIYGGLEAGIGITAAF